MTAPYFYKSELVVAMISVSGTSQTFVLDYSLQVGYSFVCVCVFSSVCRNFGAESLGCLVVSVVYSDIGRDGLHFAAVAFDGVVSLCMFTSKFVSMVFISSPAASFDQMRSIF